MRTVRVTVVLSAEEHEAIVRKYPGEAVASVLRRVAAAEAGLEVAPRKHKNSQPVPMEVRDIGGEQVRVPAWWWAVEALEENAGGHFVAGDPRQWPAAAHVRWAATAKTFPHREQWQRLGLWLQEHPPKQVLGFRYGMSAWLSENMQFAARAVSGVVMSRLKLLEETSRGRFRASSGSGSKTARLSGRPEADWILLGEWLAAGGFNWLWEKAGEKAAGVGHIEKWGDEMFSRSVSWRDAGKPMLPAPRLNGLSTERAQDVESYQEVNAKSLLAEKR